MKYVESFFMFLRRIIWFLFLVLIGFLVYIFFLDQILSGNHIIIGTILLWALTAYYVLPKIHRRLSRIYLPSYFMGRVRTGDGFLGDPVNLGIVGSRSQIEDAFAEAGWVQAEPLNAKSSWKMAVSTVFKKSYPTAPVSSLYLFGQPQDLAFQKEVNGNPRARHHVRFWRVPEGWLLPGGIKVHWLGAATYDRSVGFSLFTGQFTHKIESEIDKERDYVWQSLPQNRISVETISHLTNPYETRGGTGDRIETDGALQVIKFE